MFNLSFLNTAVLIALASAIIPLLIHLFIKHKPKLIYFSSIRFLKSIQRQKIKIIRLKKWLLLLIRMLIIILFILALSRPALKTKLAKSGTTHSKTAVAIILDNSYSMDYLYKQNTFFNESKKICEKILSMLNKNDRIILYSLNKTWNEENAYFSSLLEINKKLKDLKIHSNTESISSLLPIVQKRLQETDMINREIYFITDLQNNTWKDIDKSIENIDTEFFVIPVSQETAEDNLAIINAHLVPQLVEKTNLYKIEASVKNFSGIQKHNIICSLIMNNVTQAEQAISLQPYQEKKITYFYTPQNDEQYHFGYVSVKDEILSYDNNYYLNFQSKSIPRIAIISERPIPYFLSTITKIITKSEDLAIYNLSEFSENEINNYQLFILYAPQDNSEKLRFYLNKIIGKKKSVFLIPDKEQTRTNINFLSSKYKFDFLEKRTNDNYRVSFINKLHPITSAFNMNMFRTVHFSQILPISNSEKFNILLSSNADIPLLLIKDKFLIATFSFYQEWSNIFYNSVYPVLFYRIANFLGMERVQSESYLVETAYQVQKFGEYVCQLPDKTSIPFTALQGSDIFNHTEQPGNYIWYSDDNKIVNIISYNLNYDESDLQKISDGRQKELTDKNKNIHFVKYNKWKDNILTSRYGYELWNILLILVLILFLIEMALSYSGGKRFTKFDSEPS